VTEAARAKVYIQFPVVSIVMINFVNKGQRDLKPTKALEAPNKRECSDLMCA